MSIFRELPVLAGQDSAHVERARPLPPSKAREILNARKPAWLKIRPPGGESYTRIKGLLRERGLHTVCEEAHCPNVSECWASGTATFMLGGDTCTRACRFCAVKTARVPPPLDPGEPGHVAESIAALGLRYVVLTSVDRDDLRDGGAGHFAETIREIKRLDPSIAVEALVPDFRGDTDPIETVVDSGLDVYAHNVETVRSLQYRVRDPRAGYEQSLATLRHAKSYARSKGRTLHTKSSIMLGLGETDAELSRAFEDLRAHEVDVLTLGQYLRPSLSHLPVERFVEPSDFAKYAKEAEALGFMYVASGPMVRSSYRAAELFLKGKIDAIKLPELGEGVHEGELVKWKVKPGDQVGYDQPLCEIMTDKATVEIPSAFKGKVAQLDAKEGEVVKVGQVMLTFEGSAATVHDIGSAHGAAAPKKAPAASVSSIGGGMAVAPGGVPAPTGLSIETRPLASPSTRKLARESGVDLARVQPSGPHGRVLKEDVERFLTGGGSGAVAAGAMPAYKPPVARTAIPAGPQEERVPFRGLRKAIAAKMRQSKDHAAHFTYVEEADVSQLVQLRKQAKEIGEKQGVKVTYLPFIMKAMVAALKKYPILNSSLDEEKQELVYKHYFNIGLSIQTDDGLTAPVIKDVGGKSILHLAHDIEEVVSRARAKKLTQDDFQGGTITLTNAGTIGGLFATPIINYPEVAILGFNKIFRKPVVVNNGGREEIAIRDWTYFSLSLDHRVVDGAIGAEFMKEFIRYIENPALLVLDTL